MNLESLKTQADELGIKYSPNISAATLQERIDQAVLATVEKPKTGVNKIQAMRNEAMRLIRVEVTPMDVMKRDYHGDFFQLCNRVVQIKRFVPYGVVTHIEKALLDELKTKMFRVTIPETRDKSPQSKLAVAFAIRELPALTAEELADLAKAQQARNSIA
jgi:hypothetical protein